jgi:hypothetical protein
MVRFCLILLFCGAFVSSAFSQLVVVRIPHGHVPPVVGKKKNISASARGADSLLTVPLPFWDDFSNSNSPYYPTNTLWVAGESVSLNDGISVNPPSLGAVSFDGLDSVGLPYDVSNSLSKGFGDRLVSQQIDLTAVPLAQHDSLYLSFFFEWQGNGEPPDPGDQLEVDFKNNSPIDSIQWVPVATISPNGDGTLEISTAYPSQQFSVPARADSFSILIVAISDTVFYHSHFQFRIRSYGRISGPWDNWNVDYVYVNTHRWPGDVSFPDRTIYSPLSSLFKDYWAIPAKHFRTDSLADSVLVRPVFAITNLRLDQTAGNGQPVTFFSTAHFSSWKNNVPSQKIVKLDSAATIGNALEADERRMVKLNKIPAVTDFDAQADSIRVSLVTSINSGDNLLDRVPPLDSGDYTPNYIPIDFRVNDTTTSTYMLSNYYAYDDGTAEFGAGLNQPAAEVAYLFKMITNKPDTIVALDMYFPNFGDQSTQTIVLRVRKDTSVNGIIYQDTIALQRSSLNQFWRYPLTNNLTGVRDSFFLGWVQTSSAVIALGLDKSHDTGNRIYYNVSGFWEQNVDVTGSLMIRPVFGKGGIVTGLPKEPVVFDPFPNPNNGTFYLSNKPDQLAIVDFTGRPMTFTQSGLDDHLKIEMANPPAGIYIIKAFVSGQTVTRKIMVHP